MPFFPDEVKVDSTSRYTKFQRGTTTVRFLGQPIFYYETWIDLPDGSRKPKRFTMTQDIPLSETGPDGVKQVMSIKVWNVGERCIQVCSISQKTVLKAIKAYTENKKYGDPTGYDINIEKTGEGKQTRYNVVADPREDLDSIIIKADKELECDLSKLLTNDDPWVKAEDKKDDTINF